MSESSLENLKLGAKARYQGKIRQNVTILPESLEWLRTGGNVSGRIDDLVAAAKNGKLRSSNTHDEKKNDQLSSDDVYKQIETLKLELEQVRSQMEISRELQRTSAELVRECHSNRLEAAGFLNEAIRLKKSKKGGYLEKIEEAVKLIDD